MFSLRRRKEQRGVEQSGAGFDRPQRTRGIMRIDKDSHDNLIEIFKELKAAVNTVIATFQDATGPAELSIKIGQAINWADLKCAEACYSLDSDGNENFRVVITEAHPEASSLQAYIREHLAEAGWTDVEVDTRW
jgi:hypothetical protein